ncbi:DUF1570 domain-containing protein [Tautonia plasticadhaerens]|uniref:DUF1570 domain-containing protein n=1 Tax=Tautonia plasticadhaerens TaxID=2527974 RepID=UPI0018D25F45|nr:DUF1570 domain-containing protein [Tautonia plasticadhaerens]
MTRPRTPSDADPGRRRWLATAFASAWILASRAEGRPRAEEAGPAGVERDRIASIRARAEEAGIAGLRLEEGDRYVALGTARDDFVRGALALCEGLADDYLDHFKDRGFEVTAPTDRMTMLALATEEEFGRILGAGRHPQVTGIYEVGENYLVLYDGRGGGPAGPRAERANTITLFHEATHQLTFNSGLLERFAADVPLVVSEGLGMYGEVRRPDGRTKVGALNRERLAVIAQELRLGRSLIPLLELLEDATFEREESVQLAYAQSWLFVYGVMRSDPARDRFRTYLNALRAGADGPGRRLDLAREHLGDLEELDDGLRAYASRLLRGR